MSKLNLGCEYEYKEGWLNVDFDRNIKADFYHDLNQFPYPFEDDEFDEVLASALLEHLDDFEKAMNELYRITKNMGKIYILLPHASEIINTWGDIEHRRGFTYNTFGTIGMNIGFMKKFHVIKRKIVFTRVNMRFMNYIVNPVINLFPNLYERMFSSILPSSLVVFILEVMKDQNYDKEMNEKLEKHVNKYKWVDNLEFIKRI